MAAFSSGVAYAVSCLGQQDIVIKEKQSEAIKSIYEGKDVFAWLPTGYGKSLRYQLLLFHFDFQLGRTRAIATERSVALVISPLVSLMMDQVCIQAHGVCAAIRNSGNTWVSKALLATERDIAQGKLRFLFTAPGGIVGYSRRKQILLELSDSGMAVTVLYCVYKLMCPHTLSAPPRTLTVNDYIIVRYFTAYYTEKNSGIFRACARSSPQAFPSERPGNEATKVLTLGAGR